MKLQDIQKLVFEYKPVLKTLIQKQGDLSLKKYFNKVQPINVPRQRQEELIQVLREKTAEVIGQAEAKSLGQELKNNYFAGTADHHGPIGHPFFLNSNLVQTIINQENGLKNTLVLACSSISLNNSSYPRGVFFHDEKLEEKRLPFFSLSQKQKSIFNLEAYKKNTIENLARRVNNKKVKMVLNKIYLRKDVLKLSGFSDQITKTNFELWREFFGSDSNLIYLNLEEITNQLILKHHLEKETIINKIIFDPQFQDLFSKNFDGIEGAFSSNKPKGTFLFWGLRQGKRLHLKKQGGRLMSLDGTYSLGLNKEALRKAMAKKEIMPSMALAFTVVSFYYGLTCAGGFSQINYLEEMKKAYLKILERFDKKEKKWVKKIPTNIFRGEFNLVYLALKKKMIPGSFLDLLIYGGSETKKDLMGLTGKIKLGEAINEMMPDFYKIITGKTVKLNQSSKTKPIIHV